MIRYSEKEINILLLCALPSEQKPLTTSGFEKLSKAVKGVNWPESMDRELTAEDLRRFGCDKVMCRNILTRLEQRELLDKYLNGLAADGIQLITRFSPLYPDRLRRQLGEKAPVVLWCMGELSLFSCPCISVVGSRELRQEGREFARETGRKIAEQGMTLCSGGAVGADTESFLGAMEQGGTAVLYLAGSLLQASQMKIYENPLRENRVLLVSDSGADSSFTSALALERNRLIHAMGEKTFVAQSGYLTGGTWRGTRQNLKQGWSPVYLCGELMDLQGMQELQKLGAIPVTKDNAQNVLSEKTDQLTLF